MARPISADILCCLKKLIKLKCFCCFSTLFYSWGGCGEECVSAIMNSPNQKPVSRVVSGHTFEGCFLKMEISFRHTEEMKERGTVYPNRRNILKIPIKLNEGHTAFEWLLKKMCFFTFSWGALMVKDMKKRLPPQRKLLLTSENMSFLINKYVRAFNQPSCRHAIPLHAAVCASSATLYPLFH